MNLIKINWYSGIICILKQILFFGILLGPSFIFSQSWSFGGGGIYGDDIDGLGVQFRTYYNLPDNKICFGPEYSYFFEQTEIVDGEEVNKQLSELNFNLHYIFEVYDEWSVYPVTGVNLSFEKETIVAQNEIERRTELGANLGFGVHKAIGNLVFFAEYDHLFSELSQNSYVLGAFITLGKKKKENKDE